MKNQTILLEFNEICPPLLTKFMASGDLPNFKKFYDASEVFTTDAQESPPQLEPWIQWATVHTGLPYSDHGLFNLDEGHRIPGQHLWSRISSAGGKVWICGSMNTGHNNDINGFILPDPWTRHTQPYPAGEFDDYAAFVRSNVIEHTNKEAKSGISQTLNFLKYLLGKGMSATLFKDITSQLLTEKLKANRRWKRASILDWIQWHVFASYFRRHKPDFSTLFLNSVAHYQHVFWRDMQPELFSSVEGDRSEYRNAILEGYQVLDKVLGECVAMAGNDASIFLASGISQKPCVKYEDFGGKRHYRPRDIDAILRLAEIESSYDCTPVMTEEFLLRFNNAAEAAAAMAKLKHLSVDGVRVIRVRQDDEELMMGCGIFELVDADAVISNTESSGNADIRFYDAFYKIEDIKSGEHDPHGVLWIRRPNGTHRVEDKLLPLTAVAPMILDELELDLSLDLNEVA